MSRLSQRVSVSDGRWIFSLGLFLGFVLGVFVGVYL